MSATPIGVVVIGRNEGERLERSLRSVVVPDRPVVYVDSGSTDGSVAFAKSLGVNVVELDPNSAFTAALGRNTGWRRLLQFAPNVSLVQFVDGDCEIVPEWWTVAAEFLATHADVAVVCGRRREIDAGRNWYHRLADMEWETPTGEAKYCGGEALIRAAALEQVGGYRESLAAGEEPELCVRLRQAGWRVWRLDAEMSRHDIRMSRFSEWWRRTKRAGYAFTAGASLHGSPPERHFVRESRSIFAWGIVLPSAALVLAWYTRGLSLVVAAVLYLVLFVRVVLFRRRQFADSWHDVAIYASACVVGKWPQAVGQLRYAVNRLRGRQTELIEYKAAGARCNRNNGA